MIRTPAALYILVAGCGSEPPEAPAITVDARWPAVSQMLGARCGSLDCHGQTGRPLRLYHGQGLRLGGGVSGDGNTTEAEHDANLRATLALEPELTAEVLHDDGKDPQRLTLYRKARGLEKHKGESPLAEGDRGDDCLRSFLQGNVDEAACDDASRNEAP